jgi:5-methylcytosine-specific restriction enzyme A
MEEGLRVVPTAAPHPCGQPGCRALVRGRARCHEHERKREQQRGSAAERGYDWKWRKARDAYLREHPLCVLCLPRLVPAEVVDHIRDHKGDKRLFWDQSNWRGLCRKHHDGRVDAGDFGR